jgi:hypothetical protein
VMSRTSWISVPSGAVANASFSSAPVATAIVAAPARDTGNAAAANGVAITAKSAATLA